MKPQNKEQSEQSIVAHGGEGPTRKANARRHIAHAKRSLKVKEKIKA